MHADVLRSLPRPPTSADAPALVALHFAAVHRIAAGWYAAALLHAWSPPADAERVERLRSAIASGEETVIVALLGRAVDVDPDRGRRGIGSALVRELEAIAKARGVASLQLDASLNAFAFYRGHGYAEIERGRRRLPSGGTMACVRMQKVL